MGEIDRAAGVVQGREPKVGGAWEVKWGRRGETCQEDRGSFYFFVVPTSGAAQTIDIAR